MENLKKLNLNNTDDLKEFIFEWFKSYLDLDYTYKTSTKVFKERFDVCQNCEHYNEEKIKCRECGCALLEKMSDSLESCPVMKWDVDKEGFIERHYQEIAGNMSPEYSAFEVSNDE